MHALLQALIQQLNRVDGLERHALTFVSARPLIWVRTLADPETQEKLKTLDQSVSLANHKKEAVAVKVLCAMLPVKSAACCWIHASSMPYQVLHCSFCFAHAGTGPCGSFSKGSPRGRSSFIHDH